jgi:phospholipase/carboxylesterase
VAKPSCLLRDRFEMALRTSLGGLTATVFPEEGAGKTPDAGASKAKAVVVLCHGFGAPGDDLVGLYDELITLEPSLKASRFIFPEAPLDLRQSMGFPGRAWWLIDFEQVQAISSKGKEALLAFRQKEPEGMAKARSLLTALVHTAQAQSGLSLSRFVLGGFSQGAMLTTDVALRLEESPLGLAALSGTLLVEDVWKAKAKARSKLPVFQSHGRQDPLLPFWLAERMKDLFTEAGMPVTWMPFEGQHQIPMGVLRALSKFLVEKIG